MYLSVSRRAVGRREFCVRAARALGARAAVTFWFSRAMTRAADAQSADTAESKKKPESEKVYEPGGEVKPPKLIHYVEPEFSTDSKEAFVEGIVKISTVVTVDGVPTTFHVVNGLNAEEDRTAVAALKQWRFRPGTKSGEPVNVKVTVEIAFHLL